MAAVFEKRAGCAHKAALWGEKFWDYAWLLAGDWGWMVGSDGIASVGIDKFSIGRKGS